MLLSVAYCCKTAAMTSAHSVADLVLSRFWEDVSAAVQPLESLSGQAHLPPDVQPRAQRRRYLHEADAIASLSP